jgi:hypothetical protein
MNRGRGEGTFSLLPISVELGTQMTSSVHSATRKESIRPGSRNGLGNEVPAAAATIDEPRPRFLTGFCRNATPSPSTCQVTPALVV